MTPHIHPSGVLPGGILPLRAERYEKQPWVELGWPGLDPKAPCIDILVFDDSGSVTAAHGADPVGSRFTEAKHAIANVAQWTHTRRSKIAVLHFDHPHGASGVHPLTERRLQQKLDPSLRTPRMGNGTSDLSPSLAEAERLAEAHPDHDTRLTVFSDFELTDADPGAVLTRLENFPGLVHAVVLGRNAPLDLDAAANITVTPLSERDAPGTFAAAIHRSLTATRRAARYSVVHSPRGGRQLLP
ncbi:VWA domain-containing protein [Microbacterium candidum]|uniref:VWA domain-containing protein n=1 Tax=Microbacterium candidum TaxID=3041922 RepID=A0ABT7N076_9MICO|nr:VWA domain-containing protein [Microbacterium sp. ASV49]MDL9980096.1 VWA domain-containing protein [Microbacterium sp. ASV49]